MHHLLGSPFGVDPDLVKHLSKWPLDINELDNQAMSPIAVFLGEVALCGHVNDPEVLSLMFQGGVSPSYKTAKGLGLVHLAAGSMRLSVSLLETLEHWGVSLSATDEQGRTAVHYCAIEGTLTKDVLHFLCEKRGLSRGFCNAHGMTPMDYAIMKAKEPRSSNMFKRDRWDVTRKLYGE